MRIYLDNCCLQRPLDDKSQVRVQLESEAILALFSLQEQHKIRIVSSEVLQFELNKNPHPQRKAYVTGVLGRADTLVLVDRTIVQRAKSFEKAGLRGVDALHLACAEAAEVDYFCSCDDRLLRRARSLNMLKIRVVSPLELAEEIIE